MSSETPDQRALPVPDEATKVEELTVRQVAERAGVTRGAVNNAIRAGRLAARKEETPRGVIYWVARPVAEAYAEAVAANPYPKPYNSWHAAKQLAGPEATKERSG